MDYSKLKSIKNPLLQSAQHPVNVSNAYNQPLLLPVKSDVPPAGELDSFIGQDNPPSSFATPPTVYSDQSIPLIVPSEESSCVQRPSNGVGADFFDSTSKSFCNQQSPGINVLSSGAATNPSSYSSPEYFRNNNALPRDSYFLSQTFNSSVSLNDSSAPPPPIGSATANYRLGNLKKPAYAKIPSSFQPLSSQNLNSNNPFVGATIAAVTQINDTLSSSATAGTTANDNLNMNSAPTMYHPVYHHWFYRLDLESNWFYQKESDLKSVWKPFSMNDSLALESAFSLPNDDNEAIVATDGGRYDVHVSRRERMAIYWEEAPSTVRRCSWFYRSTSDSSYVPYEESITSKLEEKYKLAMTMNLWPQTVDVGDNEEVVMRSSASLTHQVKSVNPFDDISVEPAQSLNAKPRIVKRGGFDEFDISDGEPETVDHLLFLVHGIGQFCDLKCRSITEVVDEFRKISSELLQSHFQESCDLGTVSRIEILPVSWHQALHGEDIDTRLKNITLPSIPRLRDFANDTILDVLFYNSPVFCQVIINTVTLEINKLHALFLKRNPNFRGKISVGGHSLGSLILYDILSHQSSSYKPSLKKMEEMDEDDTIDENEEMSSAKEIMGKRKPVLTRKISYVTIGHEGTGQPYVKYSHLHFSPRFFFAFGSPIAAFIATRSSEILGEDFKLPTCSRFFNIFHPYDPIAYRIEPLIIPSFSNIKPVQIPHHKGRKRMHLELRETVSNVGQKLYDTVKNTWNIMYQFAAKDTDSGGDFKSMFDKMPTNPKLMPHEPTADGTNMKVGIMNEGNRIDYVLQEAPVEYINEYLFALASHLCYWTSRDTMLMVLKQIYSDMGILPQSLPADVASTSQRSSPSPMMSRNYAIDPTAPIKENTHLGPPPTTGFVKK